MSLVTILFLDLIMVHWIRWIQRKPFRKNSIVIAPIRGLWESYVLSLVCLSVSHSMHLSTVGVLMWPLPIIPLVTSPHRDPIAHPPPQPSPYSQPLTSSNVFNLDLTAQGPIPSGIFKPFYCATRTVSASGRLTFDKCLTCSTGIFIFHQNWRKTAGRILGMDIQWEKQNHKSDFFRENIVIVHKGPGWTIPMWKTVLMRKLISNSMISHLPLTKIFPDVRLNVSTLGSNYMSKLASGNKTKRPERGSR